MANYYVLEITKTTESENETKAVYTYASYDEAIASFHSKIGGWMNKEITEKQSVAVLDEQLHLLRSECWTKPQPETVSDEFPIEEPTEE